MTSSLTKRYIFLDTETTGLKALGGDKILEVACIVHNLAADSASEEIFHQYVNPQRKVDGTAIHGITDEMVANKPIFAEIASGLIQFINKDPAKFENIIVAHNAAFDMKFLRSEFNEEQNKILSQVKVLDTLLIARKKFPGEKVNLDALCTKYKIDIAERQKNGHSAILDVNLLRQVFAKMVENFDLSSVEKKPIIITKRTGIFNFVKQKYGISEAEGLLEQEITKDINKK